MKTKEAIIIILCTIISNTVLCQDTTHTSLVDKYYPKSSPVTPESQSKTPDLNLAPISRNQPLNNNAASQKPVIKNDPINKPVVPQSTVAAAPAQIPEPEPANIINNSSPATIVTNKPDANHIYRDTRLGSSEPQYDTYRKNDYGAGAVTTNPNKSGGGGVVNQTNAETNESNPTTNTSGTGPIYRNDRLGSSSPLYDTYKKNDYGAGSVTTSPK